MQTRWYEPLSETSMLFANCEWVILYIISLYTLRQYFYTTSVSTHALASRTWTFCSKSSTQKCRMATNGNPFLYKFYHYITTSYMIVIVCYLHTYIHNNLLFLLNEILACAQVSAAFPFRSAKYGYLCVLLGENVNSSRANNIVKYLLVYVNRY